MNRKKEREYPAPKTNSPFTIYYSPFTFYYNYAPYSTTYFALCSVNPVKYRSAVSRRRI